MAETPSMVMDKAAFAAYRELRKIADQYKIDVEPPRIVFVGETSTGKSMLVQHFLGFPCTFTSTGVATRCPVAYQLRYNPYAKVRRVLKPQGIETKDLAAHIGQHMKKIEKECTFSHEPYCVEIESNSYPDLEILDIPGLVAGQGDLNVRDAVEKITEFYVRNPKFIIVLLVDANQELVNCYAARVIDDLCRGASNKGSGLLSRPDYKNSMCTIQTKFDIFMANNRIGSSVNKNFKDRLVTFGDTYFVSMVFDARSMADETFESNEQYIAKLPELEKTAADRWIRNINQNANQSPNSHEQFNPKYRSLIGINIVRQQIQKRWLKAFYQAVPALKSTLTKQTTYAYEKYDAIFEECKLVDPTLIRESYLSYLTDFQKTMGQYVSYKAEISSYFPVSKCGTTYGEVEMGFSNWPRRQPLVWRAYMSDAELKQKTYVDNHYNQDLANILNLQLVGGSQFDRLHRIFAYMALSCKCSEPTAAEIVTMEAFLVGGYSTSPNVEKCMRDLLYRRISHTFAIGIPWFAQIHAYLCDTFRINVTRWLLSQKKYSYLAKHTSFLSLVELDFHRKIRIMINNAIQAVRSARLSYSSYVQHDVTSWLKKLAFCIPSEIPHGLYDQIVPNLYVKSKTEATTDKKNNADNENDTFREATIGEIFANIKKPQLLDCIFGSDAYLTNRRDPRTGSHHDSTRKIGQELYEVTCGRLINDIHRNFNANLITHVVNYDRVETHSKRSIANQLVNTSDMDISRMANVEIGKLLETLNHWKDQIRDLTRASVLLESVAQQLIEENTSTDIEVDHLKAHAERSAQMSIEILDDQREQISKSFKTMPTIDSEKYDATTDFKNINGEDTEASEDQFLLHSIDPVSSEAYLRRIYQKHDPEDLYSSLIEGDTLDQDIDAPKIERYINPTGIATMNTTYELFSSTQNPDDEPNEVTTEPNILQSLKPQDTAFLEVKWVPYSNLINTDSGSGARADLATFRPDVEPGWFYLGPCATNSRKKIDQGLIVKEIVPGTLADITEWERVWSNEGARSTNSYSLWRGVPPSPDYVVLGDFFVRSADQPTLEECKGMKAVHKYACAVATCGEQIWKDSGTGSKKDSAIWKISNGGNQELLLPGTFIVSNGYNKPDRTALALDTKKVSQKKA